MIENIIKFLQKLINIGFTVLGYLGKELEWLLDSPKNICIGLLILLAGIAVLGIIVNALNNK